MGEGEFDLIGLLDQEKERSRGGVCNCGFFLHQEKIFLRTRIEITNDNFLP